MFAPTIVRMWYFSVYLSVIREPFPPPAYHSLPNMETAEETPPQLLFLTLISTHTKFLIIMYEETRSPYLLQQHREMFIYTADR